MRTLAYPILLLLFIPAFCDAQSIFWTENFNNGCPDNCEAATYTGPNGNWTVTSIGTQGSVANEWFISCSENGEAVGACGAGCGNDQTLHIGSVPCTLCLFCPNGDCGASYNAGPAFSGEDPTTDKRAASPAINTLGRTGLSISFQYIENGAGTNDDGSVEYSTDGGATWTQLINLAKSNTCPSGQGVWTAYNAALPPACENVPDLRIGFRWKNNSDGVGTDPSFAVDNLTLSESSASLPVALFSVSDTLGCDSLCVTFSDLSTGTPTTWNWSFPGGLPATSTAQDPGTICYSTPGTYSVTLTVSNGAGSNTQVTTNLIRIQAGPRADFSCSDSTICAGDSIDFFDQSIGTIASRTWLFAGGTPFTSGDLNPSDILFSNPGAYTITLTVDDGQCSNSKSQINFITVHGLPQPVLTAAGPDVFGDPIYLSYQWYELSSGQLTETGPSLLGVPSGSYFVFVTDSNGCSGYSDTLAVINDGFGSVHTAPVSVFPNPVGDELILRHIATACYRVELWNLQGQLLQSLGLSCNSGKLPLPSLTPGCYLLRFTNEQGSFQQRLIKR